MNATAEERYPTEEQIETVERLRNELVKQDYISNHEDAALTAVLSELRDSRELIEAFQMGTFVVDGSVLVIVPAAGGFKIGDGSNGDERRFSSALDAYREVNKEQANG